METIDWDTFEPILLVEELRQHVGGPDGEKMIWAFQPTPDPAQDTVIRDADHPSRLVVGKVPGATAHTPLPACNTLRNQPCRPDPLAR